MKNLSKWQLEWLRKEFQAEIDRKLENKSDDANRDPALDQMTFNRYMRLFQLESENAKRILFSARSTFQAVYNAANKVAFGQNLRDWRNIGLENKLWDEDGKILSNETKETFSDQAFYPFRRLPNASSFSIELGPFHALFALFGIRKRWKPLLNFVSYRNNRFNRYLEHQSIRMEQCKARADHKLFWAISRYCLTRSMTFFLSQLCRTIPNWHREVPLWQIKRIYRKVRALSCADYRIATVEYRRVFIPKSETKYRPLGVPTVEWRIYLGLWNSFLIKFLHNEISRNQHAFIPGKGTLTCWRELIRLYFKWPDIIEFDLKGWFDNVKLDYLAGSLRKRNVPEDVISFFDSISTKLPHGIHFIDGTTGEDEIADFSEPFSQEKLRLDRLVSGKKRSGVAQGMPLSPFLSNIVLEDTIFKLFKTPHTELLMYADDGLVFCDATKLTEDQRWFLHGWPSPGGVQVNESKTFKIRIQGRVFRALKFLGLEISMDGILQANTRKGSKLIFDKYELLDLLENPEENELDSIYPWSKEKTLHQLIQSKAFGLVQARLYYGKWNLDELKQDFSYSFCKGSWAWFARNSRKLDYGRGLNVFNSSSVSVFYLADILSRVKWDKQIVPGDTVLLPDLTEEEMAMQIEEAYEETKQENWVTEMEEAIEEMRYEQFGLAAFKRPINEDPGTVIETDSYTGYMPPTWWVRNNPKGIVVIGYGLNAKDYKKVIARYNERGTTFPLKGPASHNWF